MALLKALKIPRCRCGLGFSGIRSAWRVRQITNRSLSCRSKSLHKSDAMKRNRIAVIAVILAVIVVGFWFSIPYINIVRQPAFPKCASNMRQLGQALTLYAMDHQNRLPDTLEEVLATEEISPEV